MYLNLLLPEAILAQKCAKYRLVAGLHPDPLSARQIP